jgi:hypothetical protein
MELVSALPLRLQRNEAKFFSLRSETQRFVSLISLFELKQQISGAK